MYTTFNTGGKKGGGRKRKGKETRCETKLRERGDKERSLKMSDFILRVKQAREVNPPHHPFICGL